MSDLTEKVKKVKKGFEYKWVVVVLTFLMMFIGLGFCSGTKSLFFKPITQFLNIDRTAYSLNDSMRYIFTTVVNFFFGSMIARFGSKKLICAGTVSLGLAMLVAAFAESVFVFYISGALLGVGFSWLSTTMAGYVINRWIDKNKGTVLGIVFAANGIGGALAAQIVTPLISSAPDGYKSAYLLIATILAVLLVVILLFYKDKPITETENHTPAKKSRGQNWSGIEFKDAVKKPYFYMTLVCVFLSGLMLQSITGVAPTHMSDVGISSAYIATVTSVSMLALACSKFVCGFIYDKFGLRVAVTLCSGFAIVAMITLTLLDGSETGEVLAIAYALFAAIALPMETIMIPIYSNDLFGQKSYNKVLGIFVSTCTAGFALGAPLINTIQGICGSYNPAFYAFAIIMAVVVVLLQIIVSAAQKERKRVEEQEALIENE